jgi:hypothetical protein
LTTTYRTLTLAEAREMPMSDDVAARLESLEHRTEYGRAVFLCTGGYLEQLLGADGGELEDQTLGRDWSWVAGALNDAFARGRSAGLNQVDVELQAKLDELMQRCAQASYDDTSCSFGGATWNRSANSFEAGAALQEVAEILGIDGPDQREARLVGDDDLDTGD